MKKTKLSLLSATLFFITNSANAIQMTDYKLADSFYDQSYIGMNFDLKNGNQDQTSYNGTFIGDYETRFNSKPASWNFNINAKADLSKGPNSDDRSEDSYQINTNGYYDKYLHSYDKFFIYGSGEGGLRKLMGTDSDKVNEDDPFLKIGAGLGFGRIYYATPLAKTLRIIEDLVDYDLIAQPSDKTILKIAEIIDKESEFKSKHGLREYKKYWFEAIEDTFKIAGVLIGNNLGAFGIIRMDEILFNEKVSPRYHGFVIRSGVGQILSSYDGKSTDPTLDLMFEYGKPIGYVAQFYNIAKYSTILAKDVGHIFTNNMSYTFEISDMIDWESIWSFRYDKATDEKIKDIYTNTLSSTFRFYIANRLSLNMTLSLSSVEDDLKDNGNDELSTRFNFGITYRLK